MYLFYELLKLYLFCEKIGVINGVILILVGMFSSNFEDVVVVEYVELVLVNLEWCDYNVK